MKGNMYIDVGIGISLKMLFGSCSERCTIIFGSMLFIKTLLLYYLTMRTGRTFAFREPYCFVWWESTFFQLLSKLHLRPLKGLPPFNLDKEAVIMSGYVFFMYLNPFQKTCLEIMWLSVKCLCGLMLFGYKCVNVR